MSVTILFISFLGLLMVGIPVAYCLGVSSILYFLLEGMPLVTFAQRFFSGLDSFTLLCIPGFMLAGNLMNTGGITTQIVYFCNTVIGHIRGGLGLANIGASMLFAGVSGTAAADASSLGGILIPAMVKDGYDPDYAVGVTAASSCVGPIIPPSVPMIMAGTLTGISVSKMFVAGMLPGILMGIGMCVVAYVISKKRNYPKNERRSTLREILHSGKEAFWALMMTVLVLVCILTGIVTPTEASIIAVVFAMIIGFFVYKQLTIRKAVGVVRDSMVGAAGIMVLVGFANVFAYILTKEQIPTMIANAVLEITQNKFVILLLINILLIFVGCFMETIAALTILFPVLLPVVVAVGVSPIQFGVMAVLNLVLGLTTPPVGVCLFITSSIGKISIGRATKAVLPFLIWNIIVLLMVTYIPPVTLALVQLFYGAV